jgi:hypothetical protein
MRIPTRCYPPVNAVALAILFSICGMGSAIVQGQNVPAEADMQEWLAAMEERERSELEVADNLDSCTKSTTTRSSTFSGETVTKEILGIVNGKCHYVERHYVEAVAAGWTMECRYTESERKAVAQYYRDVLSALSTGASLQVETSASVRVEASLRADLTTGEATTGEQRTRYMIDGREVENPVQQAMDTGVCVVSAASSPTADLPGADRTPAQDLSSDPPPGRWAFSGKDSTGVAWTGTLDIDAWTSTLTIDSAQDQDNQCGLNVQSATYRVLIGPRCSYDPATRTLSFSSDGYGIRERPAGEPFRSRFSYTAVLSADRKSLTGGKWTISQEAKRGSGQFNVVSVGEWSASLIER